MPFDLPVTWCASSTDARWDAAAWQAMVAAAWDRWEDATDCAVLDQYAGDCGEVEADVRFLAGPFEHEPGVMAFFDEEERTLYLEGDARLVTDADIAAGQCASEFSVDRLLAYEVGRAFGLPVLCTADNPCENVDLTAVMAGGGRVCEPATLAEADRALVADIPGSLAVTFGSRTLGVGQESCFTAESEYDLAWDFGDGGAGEGAAVCHVWASEGTFEVTATLLPPARACHVAGILACGAPRPEDGSPLVVVSQPTPGRVEARTKQDPSVPGCAETTTWRVRDAYGDVGTWRGLAASFELDAGSYTIEADVAGPGGHRTVTTAVDVARACGCGGATPMILPVLLAMGLVRRR